MSTRFACATLTGMVLALAAGSLPAAALRHAVSPPSGAARPPAELEGLRMSTDAEGTQIVLDLSRKVPHSLSVLGNPNRIVLDVADTRMARGVRPPAVAGPVRQVRIGRRADGHLRIVFDLSRPIRTNTMVDGLDQHAGCRLLIDLRGAAGGPRGAAGGPRGTVIGLRGAAVGPRGAAVGLRGAAIGARVAAVGARGAMAADTPVKADHARPDARSLVIAIDAGHGGEDPGAIGKFGTQEKDVVLAIARSLAQRVNAEPGMRAVLTRDGDYFVPLRDRMRRARAQQADLFVSIHADSIRDRSVDGSSVYILSQRGASDEAARWLAERENASDLIGGVSLDDKGDVLASVLLDLSQSASLSASQAAAEHVLRQLNRVGEIRKPQVQQARFVVLKSPDIPSMLVETAYISNPQEELRLRGATHQAKLAGAIHQGLRGYFYDDPPAGSRIAELAGGEVAPGSRPDPSRSEPARAVLATARDNPGR